MLAKGVDSEIEVWKKYYLEKLQEQEDEYRHRLSSRTQARLERENEECPVENTHKQSVVIDDVRAETRQTSSEANGGECPCSRRYH